MTRINTSYPDRLYYPMANEPKRELPFPLANIILTAGLLYLHEYGHAFTANFLYKNANPQITFTVTGGNCIYNSTQLSELGEKFGPSHAKSLVASAGSIVEMIAMLGITVLTRSDKRTAQLMLSKAAQLSVYALSGLFSQACFPGHDFCVIRNRSGNIPYGLLTAACLATTALITKNALQQPKQPVIQRAKYTYFPREHQTRRVAPISYYPCVQVM